MKLTPTGRFGSRHGWSLNWSRDDWGGLMLDASSASPWSLAPLRCTLDGLRVTHAEAMALVHGERCLHGCVSMRQGLYGSGIVLDGIEVSEAEAIAIRNGTDPLLVLLPGSMIIRALSQEELEAG